MPSANYQTYCLKLHKHSPHMHFAGCDAGLLTYSTSNSLLHTPDLNIPGRTKPAISGKCGHRAFKATGALRQWVRVLAAP